MNWYVKSNLEPPFDKMVGLIKLLGREQYVNDLIKYWKTKTPEELKSIHEKLKEEYFKSLSNSTDNQENLPEELENNFSEIEDATGVSINRYVWGTQEEIAREISNGLVMNSSHGDLPNDWYYLHAGSEEWVAVLYEDYQRDGPVCELEISNLPEGFFIVNDTDVKQGMNPNRETYPDSYMIVSKQNVIPPQCVKITRCFDTQEMVNIYPSTENEEY